MKQTTWQFVQSQWRSIPPVATADLSGKTVAVIGANTGIGFQATKHFARMNPGRLILGCRSKAKGDAAAALLEKETGYRTAEIWLIDLSSFASVCDFADRFEKENVRLDILVSNAAVAGITYRVTQDGWEEALQVNNLSTSLLALLLAPRLVDTGKKYETRPRLVIVGSAAHYALNLEERVYEAESSWQLLTSSEYCTPQVMSERRYGETKLLNIMFMLSLADLLKETPVIVNAVDPGYCYSDLRRDFSGVRAVVDWVMEKLLAWTPEQGSRNLVYGAVGSAEDPDKLDGAYLALTEIQEPSDHIIGEVGKTRLNKVWNDLIRELGKVDERVPVIVKQYSS